MLYDCQLFGSAISDQFPPAVVVITALPVGGTLRSEHSVILEPSGITHPPAGAVSYAPDNGGNGVGVDVGSTDGVGVGATVGGGVTVFITTSSRNGFPPASR